MFLFSLEGIVMVCILLFSFNETGALEIFIWFFCYTSIWAHLPCLYKFIGGSRRELGIGRWEPFSMWSKIIMWQVLVKARLAQLVRASRAVSGRSRVDHIHLPLTEFGGMKSRVEQPSERTRQLFAFLLVSRVENLWQGGVWRTQVSGSSRVRFLSRPHFHLPVTMKTKLFWAFYGLNIV